ncbi:hypothetical protein HF650_22520 [Kosakonia sp. SMBL-WEM22]|uniref:hypothetical protein n=1 Tax=Kosakonia sp. SMBL-WEM22 TaxID=2725560 RepID=UPI001658F04E|nr:hypothetical protein [Kosakonia sp. SMBL-WEM22]MDV5354151.1 hypothetical protein [Enterobacter asburiae]QNQ22298.1 hypothetical protein HF650_22520 [Kosakonia sp. SMBL-WEM22]
MIRDKLVELKFELESAGWKIKNESEAFSVADDKIEWQLDNEYTSGKETLIFFLFDDLGRRTDKLSDLFYVMRVKDKVRLYIDDNRKEWASRLKEFVYTIK